jgi:hypothetical protein
MPIDVICIAFNNILVPHSRILFSIHNTLISDYQITTPIDLIELTHKRVGRSSEIVCCTRNNIIVSGLDEVA